MTTPTMKMRDYSKGENHKDFGDGKDYHREIRNDRVYSGIVVGDSCMQSAGNRFF